MDDIKLNEKLYFDIIGILEFYFSDSNLTKDRYMSRMLQDDPDGVPIEMFLTFNKLKAITSDLEMVRQAIMRLSRKLIVSEDGTKVKTIKPFSPKENMDDCTIYVECIHESIGLNGLKEIFSMYGEVDYISLPKYDDGRNKGFAFVEFANPDIATHVVEEFKSSGCYLPCDTRPEDLWSIRAYCQPCKSQTSSSSSTSQQSSQRRCQKRKRSEWDSTPSTSDSYNTKMDSSESQSTNSSDLINLDNLRYPWFTKLDPQPSTSFEPKVLYVPASSPMDPSPKERPRKDNDSPPKYGMRILTKADWKKLRNAFLNEQRKKANDLKKGPIYFSYPGYTAANLRNFKVAYPGTVVLTDIGPPCYKVQGFKERCKEFYPDIVYVDIKPGDSHAYMRFSNGRAAIRFVDKNRDFPSARVITGQEEINYWKVIHLERAAMIHERARRSTERPRAARPGVPPSPMSVKGVHVRFDN